MPVRGVARGPLPGTAEVVVVGAGIQGLALAYELARRGRTGIVVVDAAWPGYGASGRNGEMVRSAFASDAWCGLFSRSLERWGALSAELGMNVLLTRPGYLSVADTPERLAQFRSWLPTHARYGMRTRMLDAGEVREACPALAPGFALGGLIQEDAGFAHHDAAVWAYAAAAARLGVQLHPFTRVTGLRVAGGRIAGVETSRGAIAAPVVIDAAGARAAEVARLAGVDAPVRTMRLEALVTESLRPFLRVAVALQPLLGYCHQTTRGEFVGGTEQRVMEDVDSLRTTYRGLRDACQKLVTAFPLLAGVRVLRQWAGTVAYAPDLAPVLGPAPAVDGLWLATGWVYGFMGAPGAGDLLAEAIVTGRVPAELEPFAPDRFARGRPVREGSLVVASEVAGA